MRIYKKLLCMALIACVCIISSFANPVSAKSVSSVFSYSSKTKLYTEKKIIKGKKQLKKGSSSIFQVASIKGNKIKLRASAGVYASADPYFKSKTKTYKLSSKCKYYYTNVSYPTSSDNTLKYKKISLKDVKTIMSDPDFKAQKSVIYDNNTDKALSKKYYIGGFFGQVYIKNGKVEAIIMNGGD